MEIPNPVQGLKLLKIQCRFWTFLIYNTEKSNLCIDFGRDQTLDQQCKKTAKTSHGIANTLDSVSLQSFSEI